MRPSILLLLIAGCGSLPHPVTSTIPRLRPTANNFGEQAKVSVTVEAVTSYNWRKYKDAMWSLAVEATEQNQVRDIGDKGTSPGGFVVRYQDITLLSLPAFHVRIVNHSGHPLALDAAHFRLDDDMRVVEAMTPAEVREFVENDLRGREAMQGLKINPEQLTLIRSHMEDMALLHKEREIPDGAEWIGYVSFQVEEPKPIEHVVFRLEDMKSGAETVPTFRFPFIVERRHAARACKDGSQATPLGACAGDEQELIPADDGPCIQKTRNPQHDWRVQWWVGTNAVADSDLHRTLLAQPASAQVMKRGLILRGLGYALVGAGLLAAAGSAFYLGTRVSLKDAPAGLSFLSLAIVGGGLGFAGSRRTEDAIRAYNEQADAGGVCSPVW